jgi:hypothetical protein
VQWLAPGCDRGREEQGIEGEDAAWREELLEGRLVFQTIGLSKRW